MPESRDAVFKGGPLDGLKGPAPRDRNGKLIFELYVGPDREHLLRYAAVGIGVPDDVPYEYDLVKGPYIWVDDKLTLEHPDDEAGS